MQQSCNAVDERDVGAQVIVLTWEGISLWVETWHSCRSPGCRVDAQVGLRVGVRAGEMACGHEVRWVSENEERDNVQ
jgi:hypothetical protein